MDLPEHDYSLRRDQIDRFLDEYDSLVYDAHDEDQSEEDRAEFQSEVDSVDPERVQELRAMINESDADNFIRKRDWDDYASDMFDEIYLYRLSDEVKSYIDYDKWANDLLTDYTPFDYDGETYYGHD